MAGGGGKQSLPVVSVADLDFEGHIRMSTIVECCAALQSNRAEPYDVPEDLSPTQKMGDSK